MRAGIILYILGILCLFLGISMLVPASISLAYGESSAAKALFFSSMFTSGTSAGLFILFKERRIQASHREGFAITVAVWVAAGLFGSLPYILSGSLLHFVDKKNKALAADDSPYARD